MRLNTKKVYLNGLFLVFLSPIWSQVQISNPDQEVYALEEHLYILEDPEGTLTYEEIVAPGNQGLFQPYGPAKENMQPDYTYWGRIQLDNELTEGQASIDWILQFNIDLTDLQVYVVRDGNLWQFGQSGFFIPFSERTFAPTSKANLVQLSLPAGEGNLLYFRAFSARYGSVPELEPKLVQSATYMQSLSRKKQNHALFTGFILMMLAYNFFLFFYARDRAYIYYSVYLFCIAVFSGYNSGDLTDFVLKPFINQTPQYGHYFKLVAYLGLMAYMAFLRDFMNLAQLLPKWDRIFKLLTLAAIPTLLLDSYLMHNSNFNYDISDPLTFSYALVFLIISLIFVVPLYKTPNKRKLFIIAGIVAMNIGIFLTGLDRIRTIDFTFFYFKVGNILEIIAFSLGLAYRQRIVERERQAAKFALEKSQLIQQQETREAQRLKEVDQLKTQLYTNITHELRTPLSVIMGMAGEIEGNENPKKMIQRNSARLLRLVRQILDLSKLESGTMDIKWEQVDVIRLLRYLTESFQSYATSRHIQLEVRQEVDTLLMDIDVEKLQQIISNLLSNAIKFTPEDGKIILHISETQSKSAERLLQLKVQDSGKGIPPEHLTRIFSRFYQVDNDTHQDESTGIGLALVKELVQLLGGKIVVQSELDRGSTFSVLLPITNQAEFTNQFYEIEDNKEEVITSGVTGLSSHNNNTPILLLIEDNPDIVYYVQSILQEDYSVLIARDGKTGIKMALEHIPDIIVSDVRMPGKNGFEVCEKLKEDERTSHVPIILLTAQEENTGKIKGWKSGADEYLTKPFNKEELLIRLEQLLEDRKRLRIRFSQGSVKDAPMEAVSSSEQIFVDKLRQIISENLEDEDFLVSDLIREVRLTHNQLYRKLKMLTDKTPSQFIRSIRMEKAIHLFKTTDMNVSEVAFSVGYKDPSYFSRVFQKEFGYYPKKWTSSS